MQIKVPESEEGLYSIIREWRSKHSNTGMTFFRGQPDRYMSPEGKDWILPSICRASDGFICQRELNERIKDLDVRLTQMSDSYIESDVWSDDVSINKLLSDKFVGYGLCQHYELCKTPHLDVSEDFEVAYSFAKFQDVNKGFIYLISVPVCPHLINIFFYENLYAINLQKIVIPQSTRPNVQKAWSLSFYPKISSLTYDLYGPTSFSLTKYADCLIDLKNITRKSCYSYEDLMIEDEFYEVVRPYVTNKTLGR
jgi:hypothetical protein